VVIMSGIEFSVTGDPAPQGSKRHLGNGVMVESSTKVKPWRSDVRDAAERAMESSEYLSDIDMWLAPLTVVVTFRFPRPKTHYGTGKNERVLKTSSPAHPVAKNRNDIDKLARAVLDGMTNVVFADDSQVVNLVAMKHYVDHWESPGVNVFVKVAHDKPEVTTNPSLYAV
jgi:crossover junction endodeoxyribonuclease RusA